MKVSSTRKWFDEFNNGIKTFEKIKSGEMKLEEAKKLRNVFKSNVNKIWKRRFKLEEWQSALKILNCFKNHEKLFLNYLMIIL